MGDKPKEPTQQQLDDRKMLRPLLLETHVRCTRRGVFVSLALQLELERLAHKVLKLERRAVERAAAPTVKDPPGRKSKAPTPVRPVDWTRPSEDE